MEDLTNQIMANSGLTTETTNEEPEEQVQQEEVRVTETAESAPEEEKQQEETPSQKNWRVLSTEAKEGKQAKKELQEAYRLLAMLEQKVQKQEATPPPPIEPEEEEFNIDDLPDDEYSDNKKLKRILKQQQRVYKRDKENQKRESEEMKASNYKAGVGTRLRDTFSDYQKVVSKENVQKFKEAKPFLYNSFGANPDLYEAAAGLYEEIKNVGIYKDNKYAQEEYQIKDNLNKPRSAASVGSQKKQSPLDSISRYNNPSKEDLRPFLEDAMKKAGRSISYNE